MYARVCVVSGAPGLDLAAQDLRFHKTGDHGGGLFTELPHLGLRKMRLANKRCCAGLPVCLVASKSTGLLLAIRT